MKEFLKDGIYCTKCKSICEIVGIDYYSCGCAENYKSEKPYPEKWRTPITIEYNEVLRKGDKVWAKEKITDQFFKEGSILYIHKNIIGIDTSIRKPYSNFETTIDLIEKITGE